MEQYKLNQFRDIMEPRHKEWSNFSWMMRDFDPLVPNRKSKGRVNPASLKQNVLLSDQMNTLIDQITEERKKPRKEIEKTVHLLLEEIGYSKQLHVIRGLGVVLIKILKRVCSGLYVNEESILRLKSVLGTNPVIFVPSHRSYADFILMSYVCFHYDIEIPATAAGMDFHGMWGMGSLLRDTGAFFMRRQFADDQLYANVFSQYVKELIVNGDTEVQFFIEGTRSRSCKSLPPKFGFLTMVLKPFFFGEVPDITIVPINVSYDRIMEEKLFANELLGVPKPKESTSGFLKSLNIINEKFGDIFYNFGAPISVREYFGPKIDRSVHSMGPVSGQLVSPAENNQIVNLAYHLIHTQQKHCILTPFNLIAMVMNNNVILGNESLSKNDLLKEIAWLKSILETLGATIKMDDVNDAFERALKVHQNLIVLTSDNTVCLVQRAIVVGKFDKKKLKGHELLEQTMTAAIPLVQLMLYVNPCMHYCIGPAVATIVMRQIGPDRKITKDHLWRHYCWLRRLLAHEFVISHEREYSEFEDALQYLDLFNVVESVPESDKFVLGNHKKLQHILCNLLTPFLTTYKTVSSVLAEIKSDVSEKEILAASQKNIEEIFNEDGKYFIHPYALSLDTISTSLLSLTAFRGVERKRINGKVIYRPNVPVLVDIIEKLAYVMVLSQETSRDAIKSNSSILVDSAKL